MSTIPIPQPPPNQNVPCQCGCNWFVCYLQAWASPGGNLILLTFLTFFLCFMVTWLMVKFGPATPAVMFLVPIAGGFAGAITTRMGISTAGDRTQNTRATDVTPRNGPTAETTS